MPRNPPPRPPQGPSLSPEQARIELQRSIERANKLSQEQPLTEQRYRVCHLVRSHLAFAIVADGFDRTSFHRFLAKRFLLRGGRLLKHIGVAAVVAAREIRGCGFPAQVAVNALVIDIKLSGHVLCR